MVNFYTKLYLVYILFLFIPFPFLYVGIEYHKNGSIIEATICYSTAFLFHLVWWFLDFWLGYIKKNNNPDKKLIENEGNNTHCGKTNEEG